MARDLFSVPIFFIVFRETLEAAIIISVLLGLVEQIVREPTSKAPVDFPVGENGREPAEGPPPTERQLVRKLRVQVSMAHVLCKSSQTYFV